MKSQSPENDDDEFPTQSTSTGQGLPQALLLGKSRTSLIRMPNARLCVMDERSELNRFRRQTSSCCSRTEMRSYSSRFREDNADEMRFFRRSAESSEERVVPNSEILVNDCWRANSAEFPVKLIHIFKENKSDADAEDADVPIKKRRLVLAAEDSEKLCQTKEFHVLTEVQKARILTAVEDAIKKLGNKDFVDYCQGFREFSHEKINMASDDCTSIEKCYKRFLLPWVFMKIIQMILCHIIQLTFLAGESYFQRKSDFLPVVVTYYLTLFIVVFSLVVHITCFNYGGIRNPCYFMGVISSSILTLTTTLGIIVMLSVMHYYRSFREILVLVFIGVLLCLLFAELCLCYYELKDIWNKVGHVEHYYVA